jgi:hypothetical protein
MRLTSGLTEFKLYMACHFYLSFLANEMANQDK